jgi:pimeloyl-ACP methyl ester carboxylesterase
MVEWSSPRLAIDSRVASLVYIAAFAPDRGESVAALIKDPPPGAPVPPILPPEDGFLLLDQAKFAASFAADVPADVAAFMADSQVPWGLDALGGAVTEPAWKGKPSWYLVATDDRMIPPAAQRFMAARAGSTVVEAGRQPRDLRIAAEGGGGADRARRERCARAPRRRGRRNRRAIGHAVTEEQGRTVRVYPKARVTSQGPRGSGAF